MRKTTILGLFLLAGVYFLLPIHDCSGASIIEQSVASVNGEKISVKELREAFGFWGGGVSVAELPAEKKKETLERLIAGRLLSQEARKRGLDNTDEYRALMQQGGINRLITALLRKEISSNVKISKEEIRKEAAKLRKADKNLAQENANLQAKGAIWNRKAKKAQEDAIAAAKKEFGAVIDEGMIGRIAKGEKVEDNAVLAVMQGDHILYGEMKKTLGNMGTEKHGEMDFSKNPDALRNLLDRDITGRALTAYAINQGIDNSTWMTDVRKENERAILVDLLLSKRVLKDLKVTDKEIQDTYAKHSQMLVRDGKKIPLSEVKEQIRSIVMGEKRKKAIDAYLDKAKKKAKIKVNDKILSKV